MMNKFYISSVLLLTLVFFSCARKGEKTVITFWGMGSEGEFIKTLVPEFEKENPDIKINLQMIPWTAAQEKLLSAYAGNNLPDVCQLGNTWVPQFTDLNVTAALDSFINNSSIIKPEKFFSGIWNTNEIDKKIYGIPWYVDTRLIFYRKDVFEMAGYSNPPKTWEELYDLSKKIRSLFGNEDKYPIYLPTNEWAPYIIFGMQNGSAILKDNNTYGDFSSSKFKESFKFLIKFYKEGLAPVGVSKVNNVYQAFQQEYFCMYISGPWNINEFKKVMTGSLKNAWSTMPLPGKYSSPGLSLAGGSSLVIFNSCKNKSAAWRFIEFLSRPDIQIKFYNLSNDLPAVKQAWEDEQLTNNNYIKAFYNQLENVAPTPKILEWEQIVFSKVQEYVEKCARNVLDEDTALKMLDQDVNKILEKRRWIIQNKLKNI